MASVWNRIRNSIERHGKAALVTVIDTAGSSPREAGARMVVQPDGAFAGTIGGGRLEYEALASASAILAAGRGAAQFREWPLGPNLGQCCGGAVTTLTETFDARDLDDVRRLEAAEQAGAFSVSSRREPDGRISRTPTVDVPARRRATPARAEAFVETFGEALTPLLLFGAGHVGRALVLALAPLPFSVRWIDGREDAFPAYAPPNVTMVRTESPLHELAEAPHGAFVVIMTHSHPLDLDITVGALTRGGFGFVGLIGSATKRARFVSQARRMGVPEAALDRLVCPIGIPGIEGKEPAIIAASVAAQILAVAGQQAAVAPEAALPAAKG